MEPRLDLTKATRRDLEEMIRRRRNLGAVITVLGALGLFGMIYLFVPAETRTAGPAGAERTLARQP